MPKKERTNTLTIHESNKMLENVFRYCSSISHCFCNSFSKGALLLPKGVQSDRKQGTESLQDPEGLLKILQELGLSARRVYRRKIQQNKISDVGLCFAFCWLFIKCSMV